MSILLRYFFVVTSVLTFSNCKKNTADTFCTTNRISIKTLSSSNGMIIYYLKYNKYGVRIDTSITGNVDSQVIGLSCEIPKELQNDGASVKISGQLKRFNADENISPQMGGDDLYYLQITQIIKH